MSGPVLKPCPFCGGKARMLGGPDAQEIYSVWCVDISCHIHINGTMSAKATAEKWNRRTPPAIRDDENHKATVERCVALVEREASELRGVFMCGRADSVQEAASALRSLIKEDGE